MRAVRPGSDLLPLDVESSIFCFGTDLVDEGVETVLDNVAEPADHRSRGLRLGRSRRSASRTRIDSAA